MEENPKIMKPRRKKQPSQSRMNILIKIRKRESPPPTTRRGCYEQGTRKIFKSRLKNNKEGNCQEHFLSQESREVE